MQEQQKSANSDHREIANGESLPSENRFDRQVEEEEEEYDEPMLDVVWPMACALM